MRISPRTIAALLALAAGAATVQAADRATLGCVGDHVSPADRSQIGQSAGKIVQSDEGITPSQKAVVHAAALDCADKYHWTSAEGAAAEIYTLMSLSVSPVYAAVRATGNDPLVWEKTFKSLPDDDRRGVIQANDKAWTDKAWTDYLDAMTKAGATFQTKTSSRLTGILATTLELQHLSEARFIGE